MNEQIVTAFKKHYGEQALDVRRYDYNTFASGWLEARATERARCAAIVERYADESNPGPVQVAARRIIAAIAAARGPGESAGECSVVDSSVS